MYDEPTHITRLNKATLSVWTEGRSWTEGRYRQYTGPLQRMSLDINDKVVCTIQQMVKDGWQPDYTIDLGCRHVCVMLYDARLLYSRVRRDILGLHEVYVGMQDVTPEDKAVPWAIAHELVHCYLYPKTTPYNTAGWGRGHDDRPWEKTADEVAYRVTGYTRLDWNERRIAWDED